MRRIALMATFVIVAAPLLLCQSRQKSTALTNQDVISMVKNALPETVILGAIQTNETDFDVSANALIALKKAGVTPKIMQAMIAASGNKKAAATTPPSAPAATGGDSPAGVTPPRFWQPVVAYLNGKKKIALTAEATQIASTKAKPTSLKALAADAALEQALQLGTQLAQSALVRTGSATGSAAFSSSASVIGGIFQRRQQQSQQQQKTTYVWALSGGSSSSAVPDNAAVFDMSYSAMPGVNAAEFEPVIVKLAPTPQADFRLVGATVGTLNAGQDPQHDWPIYSSFVEERVPAKVEKLATGHARLTPAAPLAYGQYAVALRPVDRGHRFSGEEVGKNQGEGLLFNYVWPFSVQ